MAQQLSDLVAEVKRSNPTTAAQTPAAAQGRPASSSSSSSSSSSQPAWVTGDDGGVEMKRDEPAFVPRFMARPLDLQEGALGGRRAFLAADGAPPPPGVARYLPAHRPDAYR
jgi:hypothetical protein